jgi:DNA-binding transcriptional ArsR family regulator
MVYYSEALDATFSALSDPTRRAIVSRLANGEASFMQLALPFDITLPAVSKHVRVLEDAGLVIRTKRGRVHYCRLNAGPLRDATEWLVFYQKFWDGKLDALANFLEEHHEE